MSQVKTFEELYPELNWRRSYEAITRLGVVENECAQYFVGKYNGYIKIWEYSYYYISLIIQKSNVDKSYGMLASMYTEAYSSLRCSFECNIKGYHAEALSLLRRVHESVIKMIAIKVFPKNAFNIAQNPSIQGPESKLKIKMKWINTVESSFLHSNVIKAFEVGKAIIDKDTFPISYGPQLNDFQFQSGANLSIFWMYVIALVSPRIFPDQLSRLTLIKNAETCRLLSDFLKGLPKDELYKAALQFNYILETIGPASNKNELNDKILTKGGDR